MQVRSWVAMAVAIFAGAATPALGQFIGGTSPMDLNVVSHATMSAHIGNLSIARTARNQAARRSEPPVNLLGSAFAPPPRGRAPTVVAPATLAYPSSAASRRAHSDAFLRNLRAKNPAAATTIAGEMRRKDFYSVYDSIVRSDGFRSDNVADNVAAYTILMWLIANDKTSLENPRGTRAARAQVAAILAGSPQLRDAAARAATGDELKLQFVIVHAGLQSAQRSGQMRQYSDGIARLFRTQFGQNLRALTFTPDGFRPTA